MVSDVYREQYPEVSVTMFCITPVALLLYADKKNSIWCAWRKIMLQTDSTLNKIIPAHSSFLTTATSSRYHVRCNNLKPWLTLTQSVTITFLKCIYYCSQNFSSAHQGFKICHIPCLRPGWADHGLRPVQLVFSVKLTVGIVTFKCLSQLLSPFYYGSVVCYRNFLNFNDTSECG